MAAGGQSCVWLPRGTLLEMKKRKPAGPGAMVSGTRGKCLCFSSCRATIVLGAMQPYAACRVAWGHGHGRGRVVAQSCRCFSVNGWMDPPPHLVSFFFWEEQTV